MNNITQTMTKNNAPILRMRGRIYTMRLFIAIELPARVTKHCAELAHNLKRVKNITGSWVKPSSMHITMAFLGEVNETMLNKLKHELKITSSKSSLFTIVLSGMELIPSTNPKVLALKTICPSEYHQLQTSCVLAAKKLGIRASAKPAHLTLARIKMSSGLTLPKMQIATQFIVNSISLIQSTLTPQGPLYKKIADFPVSHAKGTSGYRPSVAICILNPKNEILLIQNITRPGHWQFPQGGKEPIESIVQALKRELREEVGITNYEITSINKNAYRYRFPKKLLDSTDFKKWGYIGQLQSIIIIKVDEIRPKLSPDPREAAKTKWVPAGQLLSSLHPVRRNLGRKVVVELRKLKIIQ